MSASDEDKKSIEELYIIAMEEDEEWYNEFVRDVLGEEHNIITASTSKEVPRGESNIGSEPEMVGEEHIVTASSTKEVSRGESNIVSEAEMVGEEHVVTASSTKEVSGSESNIVSEPKTVCDPETDSEPNLRAKKEQVEDRESKKMSKEETVSVLPSIGESFEEENEHVTAAASEPLDAQQDMKNANNENVGNGEDSAVEKSQADESHTEDDVLVQYTDMYNNVQRVPMSILSELGYDMTGVARLQAAVLELIIDDEMSMPKEGLPRRWMVESRDSKEVKILRKRAPVTDTIMKENNRRSSNSREPRSRAEDSRGRRRERQGRTSDEQRKGRSRPNKKAGMDDGAMSGESSTLWMDIPTFKQYLRREADLRLMIIGPDWEDWVKGESDWRLNLYKKWLNVVENGVGDDMMDEMSYVPDGERQKIRSRPARKRVIEGDTPRERRDRSQSDNQGERGHRRSSKSNSDQRQRSRTSNGSIRANSGNERGARMRRERQGSADIERPTKRPPRAENDFDVVRKRTSRDESFEDEENRRPRRSDTIDTGDSTPERRRARRKPLDEEDDYAIEPESNYRQRQKRERR
jgi:hypothetical protein